MNKYIYPKLPSAFATTPFFRLSGSGLANCLFVYAQAIARAHKTGARVITPTWFNLSLGPYIRHQSDKRHYLGLFANQGEVSGINKLIKLSICRKQIEIIDNMGNYFRDILNDADIIAKYIEQHIVPKHLESVNVFDFSNCVAVHIRLGDYLENLRIPISWYKNEIEEKQKEAAYKFLIFSDGKDEELAELTAMPNVERVFFGNAIADIFAISKCCFMIGSDSTFSGWGAFLGQVPCIFYRKHYGPVLKNSNKEVVVDQEILW
jgi:hypothetical protein